ncbi:MAG: [citrate (pro-3S)-lyase] ligase [Ruminococcaceae bacterium]|nr:[citrate (pro-3S)-lyase] ligase [Oscillospiraceae bacterium]
MAEVELVSQLSFEKKALWMELLQEAGLTPPTKIPRTALLWEAGKLIGTASRTENIIKYIAVSREHQGEDRTATLLTALRQDAFQAGYDHLFLYTKPENEMLFRSLFFYPVAKTEQVLLLESRKNGIKDFLQSLQIQSAQGNVGSVVMNGNPFTLGHRFLIETAAQACDRLYVFVLSEDCSEFSFTDRFRMAKLGTADLSNVTVLPTGPYLISAATFPTYFLKDKAAADEAQCALDAGIFSQWFAPYFNISCRYIGTEPTCHVTAAYNRVLKQRLPELGIRVIEIPRLCAGDCPVSASTVRKWMAEKNWEEIQKLVPSTTFDYLYKQEE